MSVRDIGNGSIGCNFLISVTHLHSLFPCDIRQSARTACNYLSSQWERPPRASIQYVQTCVTVRSFATYAYSNTSTIDESCLIKKIYSISSNVYFISGVTLDIADSFFSFFISGHSNSQAVASDIIQICSTWHEVTRHTCLIKSYYISALKLSILIKLDFVGLFLTVNYILTLLILSRHFALNDLMHSQSSPSSCVKLSW